MTTKVTVDAHAGWPVRVRMHANYGKRDMVTTTEIVAPNTVRDFYVHSNMDLEIHEMQSGEEQ